VDIETNTLFVPTRNTFMSIGLRPADKSRTDWDYTTGGAGGATPMRLPNGLPVNKPPWALVTATDMNKGEHIWSRAIGKAPDSIRRNVAISELNLDWDNMGQISVRPSPLVTKSLLFLASSSNIGGDPGDNKFWAYDKKTGKVVAELDLPGKTSGGPMSYSHNGRQYIAIALSAQGQPAELVALSLPGARQASASGVAAATPAPAAAAERVDATPAQLATGQAAYARTCAVCHGPQGEGIQGGNAPPLRATAALNDVRNIIARGSAEMPGMAGVLTAEEIDTVARYVKLRLAAPAAN
jgi:quinoprotein glucose dehydrogenase